jgi:UPF0176 protein
MHGVGTLKAAGRHFHFEALVQGWTLGRRPGSLFRPMSPFLNAAAYRFAVLSDLRPLRSQLLAHCRESELKGTILLSPEGINLFVAGNKEAVERLILELRGLAGLEGLEPKYSWSDHQPFRRMLVRIKKEIIAFGVDGIQPAVHTSPRISARTLKQWLDEGRSVTLLDTRNDYEVKLGTFEGAIPAGIDHFRDFPAAARRLPPELKEQPIVTFCTGGIRCEKAAPLMEQEGFREVYQLEGGILKYFEECGSAHYRGECFVFDQRVGVDPALRETDSVVCHACQSPLTSEEQSDPRYQPPHQCPYCHRSSAEQMAESIRLREERLIRCIDPLPGSRPYENRRRLKIPGKYDGWTLGDFTQRALPHLGTDYWASACGEGRMLNPDGLPMTLEHRVRAGEFYVHVLPGTVEPAVNARLHILHEDEALIVIDKPAPLPIHPAGRYNRNTLQFLLEEMYAPQKPHAAHRLDANTTGLVVCTRTRHFARQVQPQFEEGTVEKVYLARVIGSPAEDVFDCTAPISSGPGELGSRRIDAEDGLPSQTHFQVLQRLSDGTSLLEVRPKTGRTNQIRVHLWHLGLSIVGDPAYLPGGQLGETMTLPVDAPPLCLHAWRLAFRHPLSRERVSFETALPKWALA